MNFALGLLGCLLLFSGDSSHQLGQMWAQPKNFVVPFYVVTFQSRSVQKMCVYTDDRFFVKFLYHIKVRLKTASLTIMYFEIRIE